MQCFYHVEEWDDRLALVGTCQARGSSGKGWTTESNRAVGRVHWHQQDLVSWALCSQTVEAYIRLPLGQGHSKRGTCPLQDTKENNVLLLPAKSRPLGALGCSAWTPSSP